MFSIPVTGCVVEWVGRCHFSWNILRDAVTFDYTGAVVCESSDDVRLEPRPDRDEADEFYDALTIHAPWMEVRAYRKDAPVRFHAETGRAWWFDADFIGKCYRTNKGVGRLQRAWRFRRMRRLLPFDDAVVAKIVSFM
jgi:hypothetical protein